MLYLFLLPLVATLTLAQNTSTPTPSKSLQSAPSSHVSREGEGEKTSILLPFYPPYPISSIDSSATTSTDPAATSTATDRFWQHEYRDYYASIITVLSSSTLVFAIDCAPNSRHTLWGHEPGFESSAICASGVVGSGPVTVTQGPEQWNFEATQTSLERNRTTTQKRIATLYGTCKSLRERTKSCAFEDVNGEGEAVETATVKEFQDYFSTMDQVLVTVTRGVEEMPASLLSSLVDEATGVVSSSATPSPSNSESVAASSSTAAAARFTGAVGREVMFGAAGLLGAAVFGL